MTAILTQYSNVISATNFYEKFADSSNENNLYVLIAKETEWPIGFLPPDPENTINQAKEIWNNGIALQKVPKEGIVHAKPRVNWNSGFEYFAFDESSNTSYYSNFYVYVPEEQRVWECYEKSETGILTETPPQFSEASWDSSAENYLHDTGDGYIWRFLYEIPEIDEVAFVDRNWIPVYYGDKIKPEQETYGDENAINTLFATHVIVRVQIDDEEIPTNIAYRQIGFVENPRENSSGEPLFTDEIGLMKEYSESSEDEVVKYSGRMIYAENRIPITRETNTQEEIKIVILF